MESPEEALADRCNLRYGSNFCTKVRSHAHTARANPCNGFNLAQNPDTPDDKMSKKYGKNYNFTLGLCLIVGMFVFVVSFISTVISVVLVLFAYSNASNNLAYSIFKFSKIVVSFVTH